MTDEPGFTDIDGEAERLKRAEHVANFLAFGFRLDRDLVTVVLETTLATAIFNAGRTMTIAEADANPRRCSKWLKRAADNIGESSTLGSTETPTHRFLVALADLYALRAEAKGKPTDLQLYQARHLRRVASTYVSIAKSALQASKRAA